MIARLAHAINAALTRTNRDITWRHSLCPVPIIIRDGNICTLGSIQRQPCISTNRRSQTTSSTTLWGTTRSFGTTREKLKAAVLTTARYGFPSTGSSKHLYFARTRHWPNPCTPPTLSTSYKKETSPFLLPGGGRSNVATWSHTISYHYHYINIA